MDVSQVDDGLVADPGHIAIGKRPNPERERERERDRERKVFKDSFTVA